MVAFTVATINIQFPLKKGISWQICDGSLLQLYAPFLKSFRERKSPIQVTPLLHDIKIKLVASTWLVWKCSKNVNLHQKSNWCNFRKRIFSGYSLYPSLDTKEPSGLSSKLSLPHRTTTDARERETIVHDKQFLVKVQGTSGGCKMKTQEDLNE